MSNDAALTPRLAECLTYLRELSPCPDRGAPPLLSDFVGDHVAFGDAHKKWAAKCEATYSKWSEETYADAVAMLLDETTGEAGEKFAQLVASIADGATGISKLRATARVIRDAKDTKKGSGNMSNESVKALSFGDLVNRVQARDGCSRDVAYDRALSLCNQNADVSVLLDGGGDGDSGASIDSVLAKRTRADIADLYSKWYPPPSDATLLAQYQKAKALAVERLFAAAQAVHGSVVAGATGGRAGELKDLTAGGGDPLLALSIGDAVTAVQKRDGVSRDRAYQIVHAARAAHPTGEPTARGLPRECGPIGGFDR